MPSWRASLAGCHLKNDLAVARTLLWNAAEEMRVVGVKNGFMITCAGSCVL